MHCSGWARPQWAGTGKGKGVVIRWLWAVRVLGVEGPYALSHKCGHTYEYRWLGIFSSPLPSLNVRNAKHRMHQATGALNIASMDMDDSPRGMMSHGSRASPANGCHISAAYGYGYPPSSSSGHGPESGGHHLAHHQHDAGRRMEETTVGRPLSFKFLAHGV